MLILAIDTSLEAVAACVFNSELSAIVAEESMPMKRGHAEALMPLLQRLFERIEGGAGAFGKIAVAVGPGSFTGIRVGVSAARGLGVALGIPVVGVSTLAAFAAPMVMAGAKSKIVVAIDARYDQVYLQCFRGDGKTILAPKLRNSAAAALELGEGPFRMAGNAGPLMTIEAWALGHKADAVGELRTPLIGYVARLGLSADPRFAPPKPLYLKQADAKPNVGAHETVL